MKLAVSTCRHCGEPIAQNAGKHWAHFTLYHDPDRPREGTIVSWLNRCQTNVPQYGYDAAPPSDEPCTCWACTNLGPASA